MSEQAEVIKILENIRAKRDLGAFAVEPKKTRKQREAVQTAAPILVTPVIVQNDLEENKVQETSSTVTPLMPTASSRQGVTITEVIEVVEIPKNKPTTSRQRDNKVHHSHFLAKVQQAENAFSFEQKRRFYIDDKLYQTLSLLKLSSDIPNVSAFINILITQVLEENNEEIRTILSKLSK